MVVTDKQDTDSRGYRPRLRANMHEAVNKNSRKQILHSGQSIATRIASSCAQMLAETRSPSTNGNGSLYLEATLRFTPGWHQSDMTIIDALFLDEEVEGWPPGSFDSNITTKVFESAICISDESARGRTSPLRRRLTTGGAVNN